MKARAVLYTQPGCAPCRRAKEFLSARAVEFEEKDVRSDYQALYELIEDLGGRQTPTLVVGERVIFGFDPEEYEAALAAGTE